MNISPEVAWMIVMIALVNAAATLLMIVLSVGISASSLKLLSWIDARLSARAGPTSSAQDPR